MSELALKLIAENKAKHERGEDARVLDLGNCRLTEVPEELGELFWLEELSLSNEWWNPFLRRRIKSSNFGKPNNISELPYSIQFLNNLKFLWLCGDRYEIYQITDLTPLCNLDKLILFHVGESKVRDINPLRNLFKLIDLDLSATQCHDITPLSELKNLEVLNLRYSSVSDISPLKNLEKLHSLFLRSTNVLDLTPLSKLNLLKNVDLSSTLVENIKPIKELIKKGITVHVEYRGSGICVKDCPLKSPPIEIVKQGNNSILRFFDEIEMPRVLYDELKNEIVKKEKEIKEKEGPLSQMAIEIEKIRKEIERLDKRKNTIRLSEAKCLILGEGGVGKTSLARKLLNRENQLPAEKETTQGIDVYPHDLKLPDGTDFRLNIWDFGGQEIYHATHQFFLTKRSFYILLDDTRTSDKTVNDTTFNYWLQIAELYGGNSPLLIVQNEKGDRSKQLDLPGMQARFGFVKDTKATNLLTCRGLDEVWTAIEYWLKQLPHIGEEQPKAWLDIRRELERLAREEGRDHISLEEYYRICSQHDIPEKDRALFLSSYLHDFGAFLHFQEHPLLRKTLVLNNQWATDAVYKVLDCEEVKGNFGRFTRNTLGRIWAGDRYADQHEELLALMEKFELCYKLPDEKTETWLAPQLLSVLQPDALEWDVPTDRVTRNHPVSPDLQIRYEYEFMPKGLLSQHIVRNHRYIRQTELAWKSGVVFERAGAQALVTEAWGSRNIRIRARGAHAKELLTLLSEDFDKMHERLEGLKVRKMIPCNCRICGKVSEPHFYDYEKLARRRSDGKRTVECDLSYEDVSVAYLLDGVFAKHIQNPRRLLESGEIEEALRMMPQTNETTLLLSQFISAEREHLQGLIQETDYEAIKNRVIAAMLKLL